MWQDCIVHFCSMYRNQVNIDLAIGAIMNQIRCVFGCQKRTIGAGFVLFCFLLAALSAIRRTGEEKKKKNAQQPQNLGQSTFVCKSMAINYYALHIYLRSRSRIDRSFSHSPARAPLCIVVEKDCVLFFFNSYIVRINVLSQVAFSYFKIRSPPPPPQPLLHFFNGPFFHENISLNRWSWCIFYI